jgi:predicted O-methyltransferase YrrM
MPDDGRKGKKAHTQNRAILYLFKAMFKAYDSLFNVDPEAHLKAYWFLGSLPRRDVAEIFPGILDVNPVILYNLFDKKRIPSIDSNETMVLCGLARLVGAKRICEVGTYDGNTALNLAANLPGDGRVVTIDLPLDFTDGFDLEVSSGMANVTDRFVVGNHYKGTKYEPMITQVLQDSSTLDWDTLGEPFDIVFIDGCHDSKYVRKDTENALRRLTGRGLIVWHDYGFIPDVSDVVDQFAQDFRIEVVRGTRLAIGFAGRDHGSPSEKKSNRG